MLGKVRAGLARVAGRVITFFARAVTAVQPVWAGIDPDQDRQRVYYANHASHGDFILIWAVLPPRLQRRTRPVAGADYWQKGPLRRFVGSAVFDALLIARQAGAGSGSGSGADLGAPRRDASAGPPAAPPPVRRAVPPDMRGAMLPHVQGTMPTDVQGTMPTDVQGTMLPHVQGTMPPDMPTDGPPRMPAEPPAEPPTDSGPAMPPDGPVAQMAAALDAGASLIIFPEGTRNQSDARLLPFKSGLYHLARRRPQVDLVPVWIENLNRVLPKGAVVPVPLMCKVTFGAALHLTEAEDKAAFLTRARAALLALAPQPEGRA